MYSYRSITIDDIEIITKHRTLLFQEDGRDNETIAKMKAEFPIWLKQAITKNAYIGWFSLFNEQIVAGIGMMFLEWPPHVHDPQPVRAYLLDIYTDKNHRRQGLAKNLINFALEEAEKRNIKVVTLHTTKAGRPLYETLGFRQSNEMMKIIE